MNPTLKVICSQHGFPVLHRLDFATSGLLIVPLNKGAAKAASRAFERRLTKKFYSAILRGRVDAGNLVTVDWAVGEDSEAGWPDGYSQYFRL